MSGFIGGGQLELARSTALSRVPEQAWHGNGHSSPTGPTHDGCTNSADGLAWHCLTGYYESSTFVEMKIR